MYNHRNILCLFNRLSIIFIGNFMIYTWFVNYFIVYFLIINLIILAKSHKLHKYSTSLYVIKLLGNVMYNRTCIIVYRIRLYVYERCKYHEQLLETTMTYADDVRDYENCNAAMRNIDPDCNLF